ncbi:MAG: hypothetical protein M3R51_10590 [Candidatus Eremiobacteraeota bacterium]|nr:hypothetical protein [Candidatus Eremiobacteraeota bacterium]
MRRFAAVLLLTLIAATPAQLDSQIVLERYELAMTDLATPRTSIASYAVSQAGPTNIEARHRIYRQGSEVRDETISVDGMQLKGKNVRIGEHEDRYALARLSPRSATYAFIFVRTIKRGGRLDYEFETSPLVPVAGGFVVKRITLDGARFLPRTIAFASSSGDAQGTGEIDYAPSGEFWLPLQVNVDARIKGKPARERIAWSDYRFPPSLPPSTFQIPKPLVRATLPPE